MKKNIAVVFGGRSSEHDVSIITAHHPIISSLQAVGSYQIWPIYISKQNIWYSDERFLDLDFFKDSNYQQKLESIKPITLDLNQGFKIIFQGLIQKKQQIDIVFPAMHGTYGEDGSLMGLLRMANIPFVGCDLFASAIAMDKALTKEILIARDLPTTKFISFTDFDWQNQMSELRNKISELKWPVFVKPVHLGSSIAISKVKKKTDLDEAVEVALHYDNKVLVEESVEDLIEVTLPILGNHQPRLGLVEQPLNQTEFFDFKDKYLSNGKSESGVNSRYSQLPADLPKKTYAQVESLGLKAYQAIGCAGIARIDFLIDKKTNQIYINEINTLPGSLYHHNWRQAGLSSTELVEELIRLGQERYNQNQQKTFTFKSEILQKAGGSKKLG